MILFSKQVQSHKFASANNVNRVFVKIFTRFEHNVTRIPPSTAKSCNDDFRLFPSFSSISQLRLTLPPHPSSGLQPEFSKFHCSGLNPSGIFALRGSAPSWGISGLNPLNLVLVKD